MGHFSYTCGMSGLPITGGTKAGIILLKAREHFAEYTLGKPDVYGTVALISNEGTSMKYEPFAFPVWGEYNEYGDLENIVEDDNTKVLEEYFGLPINDIMDIVCSGRKDDGFDSALNKIKKPIEYPDDWIEGEKHFDRYQRLMNDPMPFGSGIYPTSTGDKYFSYQDGQKVEVDKEKYDEDFKLIHEQYRRYNAWKEENPDPENDYGNPQYEEKYKYLLSLSGMWVHRDFYEQLTEEPVPSWQEGLDMGTPQILESLGFKQLEDKSPDERYTRQFEKDGVILYSDGTWLHTPGSNQGIYYPKDLKKYMISKGSDIDITNLQATDKVEQIYDYLIPSYDSLRTVEKFQAGNETIEWSNMDGKQQTIAHFLLNTGYYGSNSINNPISEAYFQAMKQEKLRDELKRFWRFNSCMYASGKYFDIIGTSPQDGDRKLVQRTLQTALNVISKEITEWEEEYGDEED